MFVEVICYDRDNLAKNDIIAPAEFALMGIVYSGDETNIDTRILPVNAGIASLGLFEFTHALDQVVPALEGSGGRTRPE